MTEGFKEVLTNYKLGYEKHINYLKQTNREQYTLMLNVNDYGKKIEPKKDDDQYKRDLNKNSNSEDDKKFQKELEEDVLEDGKRFLENKAEHVENAIREERKYLENAIKEKDEHLQTALRDKDEYIGNALKAKDDVIRDMENSFSFRIMRKLDKLLGRKHKNK